MKDDEIELIDYLRVIWRRKILIIVGPLVCMIVLGVISSMKPVTYRADVIVQIGKRVALAMPSVMPSAVPSVMPSAVPSVMPSADNRPSLIHIDSSESLVKTMHIRHNLIPEYSLDAEVIAGTSMIKLILTGYDRGVEGTLEETVNELIDEHCRKANDSFIPYKHLIKELEANVEVILRQITVTKEEIKKAKSKEKAFQGCMGVIDTDLEVEKRVDSRYIFLNLLYRKTLGKESHLMQSEISLKNIRRQLLIYRAVVDRLKEYNTVMIGKVNSTAIIPEKKNKIIGGGVVGLMMSLFLAFIIEYLGVSRTMGTQKQN